MVSADAPSAKSVRRVMGTFRSLSRIGKLQGSPELSRQCMCALAIAALVVMGQGEWFWIGEGEGVSRLP